MISKPTQITRLSKTVCLAVATVLLGNTAQAQLSLKRQKYDSIATRYKDEHAVYTDISERLEIREEDGALTANAYTRMEKLFISPLSLNSRNTDVFSYGEFYPLTGYDGVAYIPEKNDYKKLDNSQFGEAGNGLQTFYDDQRTVFAFYTGLTKNSRTVTTYSNAYTDIHKIFGFQFKREIPVLKASFEVSAPAYVKMGFTLKGLDTNLIVKTVEERGGMNIYRFTATNLKALKEYEGVPSYMYYVPQVIPYIISYRLTGAKKDSVIAGTMDQQYQYDYHFIKDVNLKTDTFLNKKVAELTRNAYSDREKAARIYDWVQKNMHYIGFECGMQGFVPRPADTVFKRKYGDCKDMGSVLEAMCRRAGLKAYLVLIGTNDIPYSHDEAPWSYMHNHMICAVNINDEWIFLDGTDRYLPFGANRIDLQGKEALIAIDKKHYKIVKIPESPAENNTVTDNMTMSISYNNVSGRVNQRYTGYEAWNTQHHLAAIDKKDEKDQYVRRLTGGGAYNYLSPHYNFDAAETGDMDVNISADYSVPGYAQMAGKDYFINMNIKNSLPAPRINDTGRHVPYYFSNKKVVRESVVLDVPKGYKVTYLPKDAQGGNDLWSYKLSYKYDEASRKITLNKEYRLKTMIIRPDQFDEHNKMVDGLRNQYKETVVLTAKK